MALIGFPRQILLDSAVTAGRRLLRAGGLLDRLQLIEGRSVGDRPLVDLLAGRLADPEPADAADQPAAETADERAETGLDRGSDQRAAFAAGGARRQRAGPAADLLAPSFQ